MSEQYTITRRTKGGNSFYLMTWSPFFRLEKYLIRNRIPAESGMYQIYYRESHNLDLLETNLAYYGGIRGTFSELVDPTSPRKYPHRQILLNKECYGRFSLSPHIDYLEDIKAFLNNEQMPEGREGEIFVDEKDTKGIIRIDDEPDVSEPLGGVSFFVGNDVNRYNQGR